MASSGKGCVVIACIFIALIAVVFLFSLAGPTLMRALGPNALALGLVLAVLIGGFFIFNR